MSNATLSGLRDYLYSTLSSDNMLWLADELRGYAYSQAIPAPRRLTIEEINARLDEAEANFSAGKGIDDEDVWRELEEEFADEDARHATSYVEEEQLVAV